MTTGNDRIVVQNRIDFVTGAVRRYLPDADALTEIAGKVQALVESHDAASLRNEPGEGEWSALRTLGHMIAYARVLHDQLDRMAYMTDPVLPLTNDAAVAEREGWESRAPAELAALFNDAIGEAGSCSSTCRTPRGAGPACTRWADAARSCSTCAAPARTCAATSSRSRRPSARSSAARRPNCRDGDGAKLPHRATSPSATSSPSGPKRTSTCTSDPSGATV